MSECLSVVVHADEEQLDVGTVWQEPAELPLSQYCKG
jgi:hypothetical protein